MLNIDSNIEKLTKDLGEIQKRILPQAVSTSLNKTGRTLFKEIKRDIARDTGLKQKEIAERLVLSKSNKTTLSASIRMRGRWFNLIRFKAKQFGKGVKASAWGQRKLYRGAFIATANKGRAVFARIGKSRLPIRALVGPNPVVELNKRTEKQEFWTRGAERFAQVFSQELNYRLARQK